MRHNLDWLKKYGVLGLVLISFLVVSLLSLVSTHHFLFNLEPYPDGLLYTLSARNAVMGRGLQLEYLGQTVRLWVPPLYALVLSLGYLVDSSPGFFVIVNTGLGIASFGLMWLIARVTTKHWWAPSLALMCLASHAYIWWLPTLPMSENIAVFLFLLSLYGLVVPKPNLKQLVLAAIGIGGLLLTRFAAISLVGVLAMWLMVRIWFTQTQRVRVAFVSVMIAMVVLFWTYFLVAKVPVGAFFKVAFDQLLHGGQFYNLAYISGNSRAYLEIVLGGANQFLWLRYPLNSGLFFALAMAGLGYGLLASDKLRGAWRGVAAVWLALWPIALVFYVVDARYIIYSIPILSLAVTWFFDQLSLASHRKTMIGLIIGLLLAGLGQLISQAGLAKEIIAANVLHRSRAWQFESIQHFNQVFTDKPNAILITALPPFLVDAYQVGAYRVAPLSTAQEFLQKGEHVWGDDVMYTDLIQGYAAWVAEGKELYISNAYITHAQQVIRDYERYKSTFIFVPVSEGCDHVCDVYLLKLATESAKTR